MVDYSILVIGKINAGKTSLVKKISGYYRMPITSFGGMIKNLIQIENPTRLELQNFGYRKFITEGVRKILNDAINYSNNYNAKSIIFDGVRHHTVLEEIRKISQKTLVIFLNLDKKTRYERYREYSEPNITFAEFQKIDERLIEKGIEGMKQFSDVVIDSSNLTKEDVFNKIKEMV